MHCPAGLRWVGGLGLQSIGAYVRDLDDIIIFIVDIGLIDAVPVFAHHLGWSTLLRLIRPLPIRLDADLFHASAHFLEDVTNVLIYGKSLERDCLVTNRTQPSWCLLLKLQEGTCIEALHMGAHRRPTRNLHP